VKQPLKTGCLLFRVPGLHPGRLTWNLRIHPWKRKIIFQAIIFRFYVKLRGCINIIGGREFATKKHDLPTLPFCGFSGFTCDSFVGVGGEAQRQNVGTGPRWWFEIFFFHPEPWGNSLQFDKHIFQIGLVQPPARVPIGSMKWYIYLSSVEPTGLALRSWGLFQMCCEILLSLLQVFLMLVSWQILLLWREETYSCLFCVFCRDVFPKRLKVVVTFFF